MYKGKSIYNPSGKAGEYSYWACNVHVGCNHGCTYCYLKKGRGAKILGGNTPRLKKCFESNEHALDIFHKELLKNIDEIRKYGLFFSFTTDPLSYHGSLDNPFNFISLAVGICSSYKVPVKILTKCGGDELVERIRHAKIMEYWDKEFVAIGFTLTGHDELELNADTNYQRIYAMKELKYTGYKTFASIEPIIDFQSSMEMIDLTKDFCDLYKIGLESGNKYNKSDMLKALKFLDFLIELKKPVYLKESLQKLLGVKNSEFDKYFVGRDYNMFY